MALAWEDQTALVLGATQRAFAVAGGVDYEPAVGTPYHLAHAIFRSSHLAVDVESGVQVSTNDPEISLQLADLQAPCEEGDKVVVRGVRYRVLDPRLDGEGGVRAMLGRSA